MKEAINNHRLILSVSLRWSAINLLINGFKLLCLLLGDIKPYRQIVIVFDKPFNRASSVLEICTKRFALFSELLHHVGYLNTIESCLP